MYTYLKSENKLKSGFSDSPLSPLVVVEDDHIIHTYTYIADDVLTIITK